MKRWARRALGDLCVTIQDGAHESPKRQFKEAAAGRFLYITSKNIRNNHIDLSDVSYVDADFHSRIYPRCTPALGDVLLTKDGANTGNVALNSIAEPFSLLSSVCLIKTRHDALLPAFLMYYIQSPDGFESITGKMTGAAIKRIVLRQIKLAMIPAQPVDEQRRIVAILDEAFEGIATAKTNAKKNLENARAVFENRLQAILSSNKWKQVHLGDLCRRVEYGSSAKSKPTGRVPVLRMGNIQDGRLDWTDLVYTDDKAEISKYLLQPNDVLFNRTNSPELVGKTALYRGERPAVFAGYLIRIHRREELLDADYLNYFLNSQIAKDHGKTVVSSSVHQANINGSKLMEYPIPAPRMAEQKAIVAELGSLRTETERLSGIYQRKLAAMDELKKSLLHQAFAGQL